MSRGAAPHRLRPDSPPTLGGFKRDKTLLGEVDTVEAAYKLIAATLPEGCGPAVDGTPDDL
ncbi:DUF6193 family natural product biosynthesis protein [Streptomyces anulatus]|uniref:DUF6193 family natural product biosynthesis protein n=1 Tax=Streptomyces anulatus TaxID=1892 RepID=UPI00368DB8AF